MPRRRAGPPTLEHLEESCLPQWLLPIPCSVPQPSWCGSQEATLGFTTSLTDCSQAWAWGTPPPFPPRQRLQVRCRWPS